MANTNSAFGLRPVTMNGTPLSGQMKMVNAPSSYGTALYLGDPVLLTGVADGFGVPQVNLASAGGGTYVSGTVIGFCNGPAGSGVTLLQSNTVYGAASTNRYLMIIDDPNTIFEIQEDSVGGAIAASASTGANADLVAGSGSTVTGFSGWMLDSSTVNTTNTLQCQIVGLARGPDNVIGNYAKWLVRLNLAQLWHTTGV